MLKMCRVPFKKECGNALFFCAAQKFQPAEQGEIVAVKRGEAAGSRAFGELDSEIEQRGANGIQFALFLHIDSEEVVRWMVIAPHYGIAVTQPKPEESEECGWCETGFAFAAFRTVLSVFPDAANDHIVVATDLRRRLREQVEAILQFARGQKIKTFAPIVRNKNLVVRGDHLLGRAMLHMDQIPVKRVGVGLRHSLPFGRATDGVEGGDNIPDFNFIDLHPAGCRQNFGVRVKALTHEATRQARERPIVAFRPSSSRSLFPESLLDTD